ncbi:hypothetical protein DFR67_114147 [Williamsia limnetica]|uniref:Uncharacterized protein n=1 Tax=Williamsia limnetica TaxID=882452 RepID=A0A318RHI0_WILLI|nr:hypothetical protein [Williamsia limnetica]PYE14048.1 hypothetical protein DFR67_114147 [Williamsia limnetica]
MNDPIVHRDNPSESPIELVRLTLAMSGNQPEVQRIDDAAAQRDRDERSRFWMSTGGGALIGAIALVIGAIITVGLPAIMEKDSTPAQITNCAQQQKDAVQNQKENPNIKYEFTGESDKQCHLTQIVEQVKEQQAKLTPKVDEDVTP